MSALILVGFLRMQIALQGRLPDSVTKTSRMNLVIGCHGVASCFQVGVVVYVNGWCGVATEWSGVVASGIAADRRVKARFTDFLL